MIKKVAILSCIACCLSFYTVSGQGTLVNSISNWKDNTLIGSKKYNNTYNEVWGIAVNGKEYGIIGSTAGTHFIDVTNPESIFEAFFVEGASYGDHIIHRDFHDYNGYLYAIADEDTGAKKTTLQIIDISKLPESLEVVYDSNKRIRRAHNIFIDSTHAVLYACSAKGGDDPYAPLRLYDISNPIEPVLINSYEHRIADVTISQVHDTYVRDNIAYLNAGPDGLLVVDFSDTDNPEILSHLTLVDYPGSGYNHSGWLSDDGHYYFMADEIWGKPLKVFDVSDPRNIRFLNTFSAGSASPFSMPHNVLVKCSYLFVSYYYDGLQVFDISNPELPARTIYSPTTDLLPRQNYEGAWGVYPFLPSGNILISDTHNGLFVVEKFDDYCSPSLTVKEEITKPLIQVFPNPGNGFFNLYSNEKINSIAIYSISGQLIHSIREVNAIEIDLSHLAPGIYIGQITINDQTITEKIIIQR